MTPDPDLSPPTQLNHDPQAGLGAREALGAGMQPVSWEPPQPEELAAVLPEYQIFEVIGRGGMGVIYKARDIRLDRMVAIKLLPPELSRVDLVERFTREARALARLDHPNIVKVYDFNHTTAGHLYFVMEYVDGLDLGRILRTRGPVIPQSEHGVTLEIIGCICDALQYAHNKGIVHRDIKPANVLISKEGQIKVADFGLARAIDPGDGSSGFHGAEAMTVSGLIMGTLDYMAPEQRDGQRVDHRADIYAVGVLFYQMLTGHLPRGAFQPPSRKNRTANILIDKVVLKALQSEPSERYQRASEVREALQGLGKLKARAPARVAQNAPTAPSSPADPVRAKSGRSGLLIWTATAALILLTGSIITYKISTPDIEWTGNAPRKTSNIPEAPVNIPKLPETLTFPKLLPESGVTLAIGAPSVAIFPGEPVPLSKFGRFDPAEPLTFTARAPGYESFSFELKPGDPSTRPPLALDPVYSTFTWNSDPPDWFRKAQIMRLDALGDSRLAADYDITESGKKFPVGRYGLSGMWGKVYLPLGEINLTLKPSGTTLKLPFPANTQWTGIIDLNPKFVMDTAMPSLKQVVLSMNLPVPAPVFLTLRPNGTASIRITNSKIMALSAFGFLAGSIGPRELPTQALVSKAFRDAVAPLTGPSAPDSMLGQWFGNFWQAQSLTKLARSEEWRTEVFARCHNEVAFIKGVLTSNDPFSSFSTSEYRNQLKNFFDTFELHAESLFGDELKLMSQDKSLTVFLKMDGRSATVTGPQRNITLKPR